MTSTRLRLINPVRKLIQHPIGVALKIRIGDEIRRSSASMSAIPGAARSGLTIRTRFMNSSTLF
ncbi:hypothetical protein [Corynebacterium sp. CCM 9203]|uniref:hypothetical protein n=1 Tax=Corynebacterium sp. CCM 9203 TaxID=3057615 RepID=UPI00352315AF